MRTISVRDRDILRRLAARKAEIAGDAVNLERRDAWHRLDQGGDTRPMILAEPWGVRDDVRPLTDSVLSCEDDWARALEWGLRAEIWQFETLGDDHVVEPWINLNWQVNVSNYGVKVVQHLAEGKGNLGARTWDPPIRDLDRDFHLLRPRTYKVDRDATQAEKERLESVFNGILPVRIRGNFWWTLGMTMQAIDLIGLNQLMLDMFDNPDGLHRLMQFLCDDNLAFSRWLEAEGLLTLNNENDYIGSGSMGYSRKLPQADWESGMPVRCRDLWVLLESQETVGVGPRQFEAFIFPYQKRIAETFGRVYYGCCEPVHTRWEVLKKLPNLQRVSVSPWCDEEKMAAGCGRKIVFSRKPNPTLISTGIFDEARIQQDLIQTLSIARNCRLEIIMKDVHTLNDQPDRLVRWVELARQAVDRVLG